MLMSLSRSPVWREAFQILGELYGVYRWFVLGPNHSLYQGKLSLCILTGS